MFSQRASGRGISWPGGADAAPAPAAVEPEAKAKTRGRGPASSAAGKKKDAERYSSSYTSISLVPATWIHRIVSATSLNFYFVYLSEWLNLDIDLTDCLHPLQLRTAISQSGCTA